MPETKEFKKVAIDFNHYLFDLQVANEQKLNTCFNQLVTIADNILGLEKIGNFKAYITEPVNYLIVEYWNLFSEYFPNTSNPQKMFEANSNTSIKLINEIVADFWKYHKAMGKYAPTLSGKGLKSNLNKKDFEQYLDNDKAEIYSALQRFLKEANNLKKLGIASSDINLIRFCSALRFEGIDAVIDKSKFIKR